MTIKIYRCITFHYKPEKLPYLQKVISAHNYLGVESKIGIVINTHDHEALVRIAQTIAASRFLNVEIIPYEVTHKWFLPWVSKIILKERWQENQYTHFMYSEDDFLFEKTNLKYFLDEIIFLKPYGFYPSFFQVEWSNARRKWISSAFHHPYPKIDTSKQNVLKPSGSCLSYVCASNPYQGIFLYDKELFEEHLNSDSFDFQRYGKPEQVVDTWGGGIAERAAFGLTFFNVPSGFTSRNLLPFHETYLTLDPGCFIHHLPNNYANNPGHCELFDIFVVP